MAAIFIAHTFVIFIVIIMMMTMKMTKVWAMNIAAILYTRSDLKNAAE